MSIEQNYLVEKRNILNELRSNNMTLQELRFFSIYLSKINSRDISTRIVTFSLDDFKRIMDLGRVNVKHIKNAIDGLLSKIVHVPIESGGFTAFQLFKESSLRKNDSGDWIIEIDAHDKSLILMFDFKEKYFSYQLWNALRLKSLNQLRIYELLKQYEILGERIISLEKLRELLDISKDEYKLWSTFKHDVLEVCKKALKENTDIKFDYEPYGKRGKGNKIINLKFKIYQNKEYKHPLNLEEFLNKNVVSSSKPSEIEINTKKAEDEYSRLEKLERKFKNKNLFFYSEACEHEFKEKEIQVLYNLVIKIVPTNISANMKTEYYDYLKAKHDELNLKATRKPITNRFGYIKKLIELDIEE